MAWGDAKMPEQIDLEIAHSVMEQAVQASIDATARSSKEFLQWSRWVGELSELCVAKNLKTYIAALGNALLAKASNPRIDVYSLKASDKSPGAYDARRSAEKVLVPASQEHRFSLGTTGPQPLNNQPFFREYRITRDMPVRDGSRVVLDEFLKLLHEIQQYRTDEAVRALAAFIDVRRQYVPRYAARAPGQTISGADDLIRAIESLVSQNSEGGGRAQAAVGGLLDAIFSYESVRVGKRNEPDRKVPGDVGVRADPKEGIAIVSPEFSRVFEVRDKNVPAHAVHAFVDKVARAGAGRATMVAVASDQEPLDIARLKARARESGVDLKVFIGWEPLVDFAIQASANREASTVEKVVASVRRRLIELELSQRAVQEWDRLTSPAARADD